MSSILRALKKLDEDSLDAAGQNGEQKVKMRRVVHRRAKTSRSVYRFLSMSLALLLLATTATIAWKLIHPNPHLPVPQKQAPTPQSSPVTKTQPRQPVPIVKKEEPKPLKAQESVKPAIEGKIDTSKVPVQVTKAEAEKKLEHPQLVLDGVLWSETPGSRVALINGRYLKEGDQIEGVSIISIEKKTVTLKSGEETWTIKLKK